MRKGNLKYDVLLSNSDSVLEVQVGEFYDKNKDNKNCVVISTGTPKCFSDNEQRMIILTMDEARQLAAVLNAALVMRPREMD